MRTQSHSWETSLIHEKQVSSMRNKSHSWGTSLIHEEQISSMRNKSHPSETNLIHEEQISFMRNKSHPWETNLIHEKQISSMRNKSHPWGTNLIHEKQTSSMTNKPHPWELRPIAKNWAKPLRPSDLTGLGWLVFHIRTLILQSTDDVLGVGFQDVPREREHRILAIGHKFVIRAEGFRRWTAELEVVSLTQICQLSKTLVDRKEEAVHKQLSPNIVAMVSIQCQL